MTLQKNSSSSVTFVYSFIALWFVRFIVYCKRNHSSDRFYKCCFMRYHDYSMALLRVSRVSLLVFKGHIIVSSVVFLVLSSERPEIRTIQANFGIISEFCDISEFTLLPQTFLDTIFEK